MSVRECDVVVVGGGLAGCALAVALARRGIPCTVLERRAEVPDVVRGELILPAGVAVLDALGLSEPLRDVGVAIEGTVLHHPALPAREMRIDYAQAALPTEGRLPRGICGWRKPLYEALRSVARSTPGVDFIDGFEVVRAERRRTSEGRRTVLEPRDPTHPHVVASMVVAADGHASRMRRAMGFEPTEEHERTIVQGFVGRMPASAPLARTPGAFRHVHVAHHPLGAAFVFPFPEGHFRSTLQVVVEHRDALRGPDPLRRHLEVVREALPDLWRDLGGEAIEARTPIQVQPVRTFALAGLVEDGFALVGDAAGCLDPFTGVGMTLALMDAALLAEVLAASEGDRSAAVLRRYERVRQRRFAARRETTDLMAYAFLERSEPFAPVLAERAVRRWAEAEWLRPLIALDVAGYDPPVAPSVGLKLHAFGVL